jgi:uroporphyrinogen decarboxylase
LDQATRQIGPGRAVQGNLDPAVLFAPRQVIGTEARRVIDQGRSAPGHVFNLGHGVLPDTDPDVLTRLVETVHTAPAGGAVEYRTSR